MTKLSVELAENEAEESPVQPDDRWEEAEISRDFHPA